MFILIHSLQMFLALSQLVLSLYQSIVLLYFAEAFYSSLDTKARANRMARYEAYLPCVMFLVAVLARDVPSTLLSSSLVAITTVRAWNRQVSLPIAPSNKEQTRYLIESLIRAGVSLIIFVVSLCVLMNRLRLWMLSCIQLNFK